MILLQLDLARGVIHPNKWMIWARAKLQRSLTTSNPISAIAKVRGAATVKPPVIPGVSVVSVMQIGFSWFVYGWPRSSNLRRPAHTKVTTLLGVNAFKLC